MSSPSTSSARVVQDAQLLLRTVRDELAEGRRPYASDVRRIIERGLGLRFGEYVQFLEKYGFLALDRRTDLLALTRAGEDAAGGDEVRLRSLEGDARYYFGDRLAEVDVTVRPVTDGKRFDKRYLVFDVIGAGGLGHVHRGRQQSIDRPVAIKTLDGLGQLFIPDQLEEIKRRLELSVREHAQLISPFIVQILDQNPQHDPPYFVMELASGGNLRDLLSRGALPPAVAVRYFVQIALGLKAAHAQGVLHRDLKPENVLLDEAGNVKLSDFGITRVAERDGATVRQAYMGYGSVGYMAPEMFRPGASIGSAVDIYALGILLYEMLVGELPGRRSPMPSQVAEGIPRDLDEIFDRMTQDSPERRPDSIDKVLTVLWTSKPIVELLDARQAPFFVEPPVDLPGLPVVAPEPAPARAPEPAKPPKPAAEAKRPAPSAPPAAPKPPAELAAKGAPTPAPAPAPPPAAEPPPPAIEPPPPAIEPPPPAVEATPPVVEATPPESAEVTLERPVPRAEPPSAPPAPLPVLESIEVAPAPRAASPFQDDDDQRTAERRLPMPVVVSASPAAAPVVAETHEDELDDSIVDEPDPAFLQAPLVDRFEEEADLMDSQEIELVEAEDILEEVPDEEVRFHTAISDRRKAEKGRSEAAERRRLIDEKLERLRQR